MVVMCEPPEVFSVEYFFNKGLLQAHGKQTFFYTVGEKVKAETEKVAEAMPSEEVEELRKDVQDVRKEMQVMRKERIEREPREVKTLRGNIADLAVKSAKQNERMTEAVELVMKMLKWLEKTLPLTQSKVTPGSSSDVKQPVQSSPSVQQPPQPLKQMVSPPVPKQVSRS